MADDKKDKEKAAEKVPPEAPHGAKGEELSDDDVEKVAGGLCGGVSAR